VVSLRHRRRRLGAGSHGYVAGTAVVSLLQGASIVVAADVGGLDSRHRGMDSGFLAAHSHAPLNVVLSVSAAGGLPLSLGAAGGILLSGGAPIDIPSVGEGLVHLGCPVRGLLRRSLDTHLRSTQLSVALCLCRRLRLLIVVIILYLCLAARR
jgi:hypothetical protein